MCANFSHLHRLTGPQTNITIPETKKILDQMAATEKYRITKNKSYVM